VVATDGFPAAAPVTVKVSEPVELGFSTDAAVMVTWLAYELGAVYVIVVVSPFPELPELVELPNVPHPGIQALPPLVNIHVAPRNCWLLWIINAVKTCCCPAGIVATCVCSDSVVVLPPIPQPAKRLVATSTPAAATFLAFLLIRPSSTQLVKFIVKESELVWLAWQLPSPFRAHSGLTY
jgi:hypothetical protein